MSKTAPRSLLPVALLSALVGLAGCHISFGSGSSSQSPDGVHGKPAKKSPSTSSGRSSTASKPIQKKAPSSKAVDEPEPTRKPTSDKTSEGPTRELPDDSSDPKRTAPTSDPKRTAPANTPKRIGPSADAGGDEDEGGAGASTIDRPGSVVAPTKKDDGAKEIDRPATLTAPK